MSIARHDEPDLHNNPWVGLNMTAEAHSTIGFVNELCSLSPFNQGHGKLFSMKTYGFPSGIWNSRHD